MTMNFFSKKSLKFIKTMLMLLVVFLLTIPNVSLASNEEYKETKENEAIEFREMHGFDTSPEYLQNISNKPLNSPLEKVLGFALTEQELAILKHRDNVIDEIDNIKKQMEEKTDIYGGIHYNSKNGKIILQLVEKPGNFNISTISNFVQDIEIQLVENSYEELNKAYEKIMNYAEELKSLTVQSFGIDELHNKVVIELTNISNIAKIKEIVGDNIFKFEKVNELKLLNNVYPGNRISTRNHVACSIGFNATRGTQRVLVTAGHCEHDNLTFPTTWFSPTYNALQDRAIGTLGGRTYGDMVNSDSMFINLNSNAVVQTKINNSIPISGFRTTDLARGVTVYKHGFNTRTTSGTNEGTSCVVANEKGYQRVCNLGSVSSIVADGGDSGGSVYRLLSNGTAELIGIVHAGGSSQKMTYSKMQHVISDLGLTGIYISN